MRLETFLALTAFAFVSSITPGPNNFMLLASGVNFGFRRTIPHMLGIGVGFTVMVALLGLGVGRAILNVPSLHLALKGACVLYMFWLAWKLASAGPPGQGQTGEKPLSFLQAAGFQWVNPKAWAMALTATALYVPIEEPVAGALLVALAFGLVNLPCVSSWAAFGVGLRRWLSSPFAARVFNVSMALLLLASLYPMLKD